MFPLPLNVYVFLFCLFHLYVLSVLPIVSRMNEIHAPHLLQFTDTQLPIITRHWIRFTQFRWLINCASLIASLGTHTDTERNRKRDTCTRKESKADTGKQEKHYKCRQLQCNEILRAHLFIHPLYACLHLQFQLHRLKEHFSSHSQVVRAFYCTCPNGSLAGAA